jgi:hypothetical protein
MSDLTTVQTSVMKLRTLIDQLEDPFARTQIRLASDLLLNAIGDPAEELNAARVNDIAFAFNDVRGGAADLGGADADLIAPFMSELDRAIEALKTATALPPELLQEMHELQSKLKVRRNAIERQTYVENQNVPLPNPPEELRNDAVSLRQRLASAGFATPALDALIADPSSLRFAGIDEIIDELDVIASA